MKHGELIAGRYELVERLGRGGMGEVWTARDRELRRDVAVKLLALDDAVTPDVPQRFEREAVAAAQISHPNVVALHDRGVDKDCLFLVMERVEGTTLAAYLRANGPLTPGRALEIAQEICAAVVAAHKAHVIHYDLKPLNVMLTPEGRVKVVDFGIAGFVQATFAVARSADLPTAGTPEYGAPEQFGAERGDERSDLYALGGVLFTLLTGQPPFTGPNGFAVVRRKVDEDAPSLASLRPDLPPALTRLVDELLRRDPNQRPQQASEVYDRIARLRAALDVLDLSSATTIVAQGPDFLPPTRRFADDGGAFEISWTAKDRVGRREPRGKGRLLAGWIFVGIVAVASLVVLKVAGPPPEGWKDIREVTFEGEGVLWLRVFSWCALIAVVYIVLATASAIHRATRASTTRPWSLRIGPQGITTTDLTNVTAATGPSGSRTFAWNHIQAVTLEEIRAKMLNRDPGLHIGFTADAPHAGRLRPAGWNHPQPIIIRADGRIPLCVLGPLTTEQHADLVAALTRHAGPRWRPEVGYLDGAI